VRKYSIAHIDIYIFAVQAPKAGSLRTVMVRALVAIAALAAGGAVAIRHPRLRKLLRKVEEKDWADDGSSDNAFNDVMEFDLAVDDDFDVDLPEDPLSLP
jgi:hypothetical protein